ncbi:MAG: hypothetical protein EOP47_19155 [Sphingobacteriaceae bacterium]|nr:MAG: hypothetical protein EOP47_19155 [Sphingobacteriaceae bacterium]
MKLIILALIALQTTGCHNTQTNATAQSTDHMQVAVKSKIDTSLRILTYGMPISGPSAMANRDVAKKFGFSYYPVAGCVVTEQLLDSVKRENISCLRDQK